MHKIFVNISKLYAAYVVFRRYGYEVLKFLNNTELTAVEIMCWEYI